jgi:hypothetical protein
MVNGSRLAIDISKDILAMMESARESPLIARSLRKQIVSR